MMLSTTVNRSIASFPLLSASEVHMRNPGTRCFVKKLFHRFQTRVERVFDLFINSSGSDCAPEPATPAVILSCFWSIL
eukprot:scaffold25251_cov65-Phaeocystis_antarctica.AAC.2